MTFTFKLSARLALRRSILCAALAASTGCVSSDLDSMSPFGHADAGTRTDKLSVSANVDSAPGRNKPVKALSGVKGGPVVAPIADTTANSSTSTAPATSTASSPTPTLTTPFLTPTITTTAPSGALFSDDFTAGNLSKSVNGWSWSGVWVDVVPGFAKFSGNAARFTFKGNPSTADTADAWAELRFKVGNANLKELWVTYYLYYPSGIEANPRGPKFLHRTVSGSTNNKFFRLYENYDVGYLMYGAHTWADGATGNGYLTPDRRDATGYTQHYWDQHIPWETDQDRGKWLKIEVHCKAASGPGKADGVLEYFKDDLPVFSRSDLDSYQSLGQNVWKEGYLLGWANSGFSQTTYAYISNVVFSTTRWTGTAPTS